MPRAPRSRGRQLRGRRQPVRARGRVRRERRRLRDRLGARKLQQHSRRPKSRGLRLRPGRPGDRLGRRRVLVPPQLSERLRPRVLREHDTVQPRGRLPEGDDVLGDLALHQLRRPRFRHGPRDDLLFGLDGPPRGNRGTDRIGGARCGLGTARHGGGLPASANDGGRPRQHRPRLGLPALPGGQGLRRDVRVRTGQRAADDPRRRRRPHPADGRSRLAGLVRDRLPQRNPEDHRHRRHPRPARRAGDLRLGVRPGRPAPGR